MKASSLPHASLDLERICLILRVWPTEFRTVGRAAAHPVLADGAREGRRERHSTRARRGGRATVASEERLRVPLYEYQCPKCGRFELIQKFSDGPLTTCPTCGSEVQKLLSAPAIQFKGTGWYITDYARKSEGKGKGESARGDGGKSEGGKSEGGKSEGGKSEGGKSEGGKSEGAKDAGGSSGESKTATSTSTTATKDSGGNKT
jgi:putative FmdB family regulatory protein